MYPKMRKKELEFELYNYWDDSLKVNSLLQYGVRTIIKTRNVFDSTAISRSILFMNSYLNSQGYYNAQ
jgi:outer membrane protein insertion porin family